MGTVRLTGAQALIRYLSNQYIMIDGRETPLFAGAFAIFGHGNVAGLGEALETNKETFPTYRSHNEQAMAHSAIAFAKSMNRRRMMMCTTSIGPGATNMVTAAALAMVNRLPVLLVPGDIFSTRSPDPVLQQVEGFHDGEISANDCFKPVSRYFDRIHRPEHLLTALPRALNVLTDPALCGPATLSFPQDSQTMAFDFPESFFKKTIRVIRRPGFDQEEMSRVLERIRRSKRPMIISGGGVHYSGAINELKALAEQCNVPVAETQAGKSSLPWDHEMNTGSIGVTGSSASNTIAGAADLVIAVGSRLQDFTTGSWSVFQNPDENLICINAQPYDSIKHRGLSLVSDAKTALAHLVENLQDWKSDDSWQDEIKSERTKWLDIVDQVTALKNPTFPSDSEVIGSVNALAKESDVVLSAAGSLPGELHKLWKTSQPNGYHMEYGFSCMGYEIAGGIGAKIATPDREVIVMLGDGSYLMLNSEIATSVMLGTKLIIILLDNSGFGCINRLQTACGSNNYNNLHQDCIAPAEKHPIVDFAAHAAALGASSERIDSLDQMPKAMERARKSAKTYLIEMKTDPLPSTQEGGCWWEVAIPEVSKLDSVNQARERYLQNKKHQAL